MPLLNHVKYVKLKNFLHLNKMLKYIETTPPQKIENLVIFIHGYGASGHDLISLAPYFQSIPNAHFIAPHAPYETGMMENSYYWFPLMNLEPDYLDIEVNKVIPEIKSFIQNISKKYNISYKNIILCGFSQGTLLALHYGLSFLDEFKAIIGFSGGILPSLQNNIKNSTPICLIHGADDEVLPVSYSIEANRMLCEKKHQVSLKVIPQLGHSINQSGIDFSLDFIKNYNS